MKRLILTRIVFARVQSLAVKRFRVLPLPMLLLLAGCGSSPVEFESHWSAEVERPWVGPDYWSNPLQDWRVAGGRLENIAAGGDRNVYLLTYDVSAEPGSLDTSVQLGLLDDPPPEFNGGFAGFRIGIRGAFHDYRDSAVRGYGMNAGVTTDGRLFIGELADGCGPARWSPERRTPKFQRDA